MKVAVSRGLRPWLREASAIDGAVYAAVAGTQTPGIDRAMQRLSRAANHSKLWIGAAALIAGIGGERGRLAATSGLVSVAATSAVTNLIGKPIGRRDRPDRAAAGVAQERRVNMPGSRSFPSGHAASAAAFASATGRVLPGLALPLHSLAALVAYSRVHTGVHYPGDALAGAITGAVIADLAGGRVIQRLGRPSADPRSCRRAGR